MMRLAFALGLAFRLLLAFIAPTATDVLVYRTQAEVVLRGGNPYTEVVDYPYLPPWAWTTSALARAPLPFPLAVRLFLLGCDAALAYLVYRIAGRRAFVGYWLNPAVIVLIMVNAQFEAMALIPVLAMVCLCQRR